METYKNLEDVKKVKKAEWRVCCAQPIMGNIVQNDQNCETCKKNQKITNLQAIFTIFAILHIFFSKFLPKRKLDDPLLQLLKDAICWLHKNGHNSSPWWVTEVIRPFFWSANHGASFERHFMKITKSVKISKFSKNVSLVAEARSAPLSPPSSALFQRINKKLPTFKTTMCKKSNVVLPAGDRCNFP